MSNPHPPKKRSVEVDGEQIEFESGSGNVFADLGLEDAGELQLKAGLILEIRQAIQRRGLTQVEAARIMQIDRPTLSKMLNGKFVSCSVEKLFSYLNRLGNKVEVRVHEDNDARMLLVG